MQTEQPLLTIGIPTWNRAKELEMCIELLGRQIATIEDSIEIFVSDNASEDETEATVQKLQMRFGFVKYSRNEKNLGPDRNFLEVFKKSSGKYIWLFSDDDFMADSAIEKIIGIIKAHEPCYIATNYSWCDQSGKLTQGQPPREFMVKQDVIGADINELFLRRNVWISFMSCNIYRRDLLDSSQYEVDICNAKQQVQVYAAAHVVAVGRRAYLSSLYAVSGQTGNGREVPSVFLKDMPEAFDFTLRKFNVIESVRLGVMKGISAHFLPLRSFVKYRSLRIQISPLIVPPSFEMLPRLPDRLVHLALRMKHLLSGRGFSV